MGGFCQEKITLQVMTGHFFLAPIGNDSDFLGLFEYIAKITGVEPGTLNHFIKSRGLPDHGK